MAGGGEADGAFPRAGPALLGRSIRAWSRRFSILLLAWWPCQVGDAFLLCSARRPLPFSPGRVPGGNKSLP